MGDGDFSMPSMPSLTFKEKIALMWVETPGKLIAIVVAILLVIGAIIFVLVWFLYVVPHENAQTTAGGPGHALEFYTTGVDHFLHLRQHS
jgi:hypothetical protein